MKAPLTTTATLTGATEIIGMMLQNNSHENVMKEKKKKTSLNRSFQMQIPLSSKENAKNVLMVQPCSNSARLQKTTRNISTSMGSIVHLRNASMMQNRREGSFFGDREEG